MGPFPSTRCVRPSAWTRKPPDDHRQRITAPPAALVPAQLQLTLAVRRIAGPGTAEPFILDAAALFGGRPSQSRPAQPSRRCGSRQVSAGAVPRSHQIPTRCGPGPGRGPKITCSAASD